jgi:glutathione S-transferase
MKNHLVIGNKNYSSWSLRPWLLMKVKGIPFDEIRVPLYRQESRAEILHYSPSAKVPCLRNEQVNIWDSLAICEYLAETYPHKQCWPNQLNDRALGRSIAAEMHSSFQQVRNQLPMNCRKNMVFGPIDAGLQSDIERIEQIWTDCREVYQDRGDFLLGEFSIADAMFAPVVLRFNGYGIKVSPIAQQYMQTMLGLEALQAWVRDGQAETEVIEEAEI